jgi:hypothetical protein
MEDEVVEVAELPVEAPPVFQVFAYVSEGSNEVALVSEHDNLDDALAACDGGLVECRTGTGATLVS